MKQPPIGSYQEARLFALKAFRRLSPTQKLRWLADITAFIDEANPDVRLRRLGLPPVHRRRKSRR